MTQIKITSTDGITGEQTEIFNGEISLKRANEIMLMLRFDDMIRNRTTGVNVNDLTQTPKNKFTDGIGG